MVLRVLLFLTAFVIQSKNLTFEPFVIQSKNLTFEHDFQPPILSLDSLSDVIIKGESVTITCRSPHSSRMHYFFKDGSFLRYENVPAGLHTTAYRISYIKHADGGKYLCQYVMQINVKWVKSSISSPVYLNVVDQLPKPSISLNIAPGVFTKGETVWIRCTGRLRYTGSKFRLHREGASYPLEIGDSQGAQQDVTFAISNLNASHEGKYKCLYQRVVSGQTVSSPFSDSIQVTVIGNPPKPLIYLPPQSAVVHRGTTIHVLCEDRFDYLGSTFYLYENSSTRPVQFLNAGEGNHSVTFTIHVTGQGTELFYKCDYKTDVLGRSINSPSSRTVKVVVRNLTKAESIPLDRYFKNSSGDNVTCTSASPCHYKVNCYTEATIRLCLSALVFIVLVILIVEYLVHKEGERVLCESGDAYLHAKLNRSDMRYQSITTSAVTLKDSQTQTPASIMFSLKGATGWRC